MRFTLLQIYITLFGLWGFEIATVTFAKKYHHRSLVAVFVWPTTVQVDLFWMHVI